jgi:predicted dehydrogenase
MAHVRVAFIGAKHPHIFPRLELARHYAERCEVVGVYDSDARTLDHIHRTYAVPIFNQPLAAVERANLAFVEGYDYENPDLVRLVLPQVSALMIEKPGAPNLSSMRELVAFCSAYPTHVTIGYMLQWSPIISELHQILASGVLGPTTLARFHAATPVGGAAEIWQSLPQDEGGLLWTDGCHLMRTVIDLLGQPVSVHSLVRKLPPGETAIADIFKPDILAGLGGEQPFQIGTLVHEDVAAGILNYDDKLVTFDITGWEAHGWVEMWRIELWGANATLEAGLMPPWYRLHVRRASSQYQRGLYERRFPGLNSAEISLVPDEAYRREFLGMLDVVESGSTDQSGLRAGLQVLEVLHSMYESSRQGRPIEV